MVQNRTLASCRKRSISISVFAPQGTFSSQASRLCIESTLLFVPSIDFEIKLEVTVDEEEYGFVDKDTLNVLVSYASDGLPRLGVSQFIGVYDSNPLNPGKWVSALPPLLQSALFGSMCGHSEIEFEAKQRQ